MDTFEFILLAAFITALNICTGLHIERVKVAIIAAIKKESPEGLQSPEGSAKEERKGEYKIPADRV